jgi:flagellar protein FliO/FliZ
MRLVLLFICLAAFNAVAGDPALKGLPPVSEAPTYASSIMPTLGSLALVIAAIFATGFFLRRMNPNLKQGGGLLRPVSQLSVGPKEKIAVIQFQGELLVLGITASQITLLSKGLPSESQGPSADAPSEGALVAKWLGRGRTEKSATTQSGANGQ